MTPTSPTLPFSAIRLYKNLQKLVGLTVTKLSILSLLLVTIFGLVLTTSINTYAQDAGEVSVIGSIGFKECNFVTGAGTKTVTPVADPDAQFQKCVGSVLQFFFALALFIIAVRIGMEAFANINPVEAGKAISNTITLVSDVTIGLLLIGSPGIFLSFFNPTTLSLAGIVNLQRLSGNKPPADAVIGADGKPVLDSNGAPVKKGEGDVPIYEPLKYENITPEQAAELLKNPEEFQRKYKLALTSIKENFLTDLKAGKVDWKDSKNVDLMKFLKLQSGDKINNMLNEIYSDVAFRDDPYFESTFNAARVLPLAPFTLRYTGKEQDTSGFRKLRDYVITCAPENASATEIFKDMCGKTVSLMNDDCNDKPYIKSPNQITSGAINDNCLVGGSVRNTSNIK